MTTGEFIRSRRIALGLSQTDVSAACGVTRSAVCKWEKGDIKNAKRDKIEALAKVLMIDPMEITRVEIGQLSTTNIEPKQPTMQEQLVSMLMSLDPEQVQMVRSYVEFLRANRKD